MKKTIIILIIILLIAFNLLSNEVQNNNNKENNNEISYPFRIKPSIHFSGCSMQFFDNNDISYGDYVYDRGMWFSPASYENNLKEPVFGKVNEIEIQKLCRKYYSLINFAIGTGTAGLLSLMAIPGSIMVMNSRNYPLESNERLLLYSFGVGLIGGGATGIIIFFVYGIITIVFGAQYSKTKKSILENLNNIDLSIKTKNIKIKFDLLLTCK